MPIISDQEYKIIRDAATMWVGCCNDPNYSKRLCAILNTLDDQMTGTRRYKETKEIIGIDGSIAFLRADEELISSKDWSVYDGTGLIIDNQDASKSREIIANVITPQKAEFIVKACRAYREVAR